MTTIVALFLSLVLAAVAVAARRRATEASEAVPASRAWGAGDRRPRSRSPRTVARDASGKKKILFLISDTGGGHRASAEALVEALATVAPDVETEVVDMLTDVAPWPFNQAVPLYKFLGARPRLWRLAFYATAWLDRIISDTAPWPRCAAPFEAALGKSGADVVVSVHPMLQTAPLDALEALERRTGVARPPFATVVTDLGGAHPTWFSPRADAVFVPSRQLAAAAARKACGNVLSRGLPIRRAFCGGAAPDKATAKAALGLPRNVDAILVMGGGDGFGALRKIVDALAAEIVKKAAPATIVVACGRNAALKADLEAVYPGIVALGFTKAIHEWMAAADLLLTKAGPGTIAEASALGLPVLLTGYLPGQEYGNVSYVEDEGLGAFVGDPENIATEALAWLGDPAKLAAFRENALRAARPDATVEIAKDLARLAFDGGRRAAI